MGKYEEAKKQFEKPLKVDKAYKDSYVNLAQVNLIQGDLQEAIVQYTNAINSGANDADIYFNIGRIYAELGDEEKTFRYINKAININPLEGSYYVAKARQLVKKNKLKEAIEVMTELNRYCPDAFEAYHYSFLIYVQMGEYEKADQVLEIGLKEFPLDIGLYYDKLRLLNIVGEFDAALELIGLLEKAPGFEDQERNIRVEEARIYLQTGKADKAIELLEKAINMDGAENFEAHYLLMNSYLSMARFEDATRIARIMIDADDNSEYARSAYYYEAMCLMKCGKTNDAKARYQAAIKKYKVVSLKNPTMIDCYMFRALCHKDIEEYDKALETIDYLIKLKDDYAPAHLIKSGILKDMGKEKESQEEETRAKSLDTDLGQIISNLQQ